MPVCGGFTCTKTALTALNAAFLLVSAVLIGVAAYCRAAAMITSIGVVSAMIACGVFLFLVSLLGLLSARLHNQAMLFFYIIVLFLVFLLEFSVACACLAVNASQQSRILESAWRVANNATRADVQNGFACCGFKEASLPPSAPLGHPACSALPCCSGSRHPCCTGAPAPAARPCPCTRTCYSATGARFNQAVKLTGAVGLLVAFAEIVGVWLAIRYRNLKDPRADPSAFL